MMKKYLLLFFLSQIIPVGGQDMGQLALRARVNLYEKWNFDSVEYYFSKIINKEDTPAFAYSDFGWYLLIKGKQQEGLGEIRKAAEMDPTDVQLSTWYSWALLWNHDITGAHEWIDKALKLGPDDGETLHLASRIAVEMNDFDEALHLAQMTASTSPSWRGILPLVYARIGQVEKAKEWAQKFADENQPSDNWFLMEMYTLLKMDDKALEFLQMAFDNKYPFMPWLRLDPGVERLHQYALFKEIISQLNLPE